MKEIIIKKTVRIITIVVGVIIVLVGIVLIPYPGPGWLVVFAGLAVLAEEISTAKNLLDFLHDKYDKWQEWLGCQNKFIQFCFWIATGIFLVITAWLLNTFGYLNSFFNLDMNWLSSPLFN